MTEGNLMLHCGARPVTRDELYDIAPPPPQGPRHVPKPHHMYVTAIDNALVSLGVTGHKFRMGVGGLQKGTDGVKHNDVSLFGVVDMPGGTCIGFRSNLLMRLAYTMVAGLRVFVCDNLAITGEERSLKLKHTCQFPELEQRVLEATCSISALAESNKAQFEALRSVAYTDHQAQAAIYRMVVDEGVPAKLLKPIGRNYFNALPSTPDCEPRSAYGLHNAATRVFRKEPLQTQMRYSAAASRAVGLQLR